MRFEFATASRIVVGPGSSREIPGLAAGLGTRALLVHGKGAITRGGPVASLLHEIEAAGLVAARLAVDREPDVTLVSEAAQVARANRCDMVIGIGGGSVLDTAKAAAALAANDGQPLDYMEIVGAGRPLEKPALPVVAVPTTAGTGSEVTRNAVIAAHEARVKVSIRHPSMLPHIALVDSLLTHDLPREVTASSGLDALTQLLEAYVSCRSQPITDGLCLEGLSRVGSALRRAYHSPDDADARESMCIASLLSGMALANSGLGLVHGLAGALGGAYPAPHGAACAALLPAVTATNILALRQKEPQGPALKRYETAARALFGSVVESPFDLPSMLGELVREMDVRPLSDYGLTADGIPALAEAASSANSTRGNPIALSQREIRLTVASALSHSCGTREHIAMPS